jgi:tRNA nucleotidyltransferase (CCA-adding enzyme)
LRVARFAARYKSYGFSIAPETISLMKQLCQSGELKSLSAERVWVETAKALSEEHPEVYFEVLKECDGLNYWFAELDKLWGVPNPEKWHPEIDTGIHVMMVLQQAAKLSNKISVRFAALLHDLGKGITDPALWPSHRGHEKSGLLLLTHLCARVKAPNAETDLAKLVCEHHGNIHKAFELRPQTIVALFDKTDAWRRPERFEDLLLACEADARGRLNFENRDYPQRAYLQQCYAAASSVDVKEILAKGVKGPAIKEAIYQSRCTQVRVIKDEH